MKMKLFTGFLVGVLLAGAVGMTEALTLSDVGSIDQLRFQTMLPKSGETTEIAWVNSVLGGGYDLTFKDNTTAIDWYDITDMTATYAYELEDEVDYFLIKTGTKTGNTNQYFLFDNIDSIHWAVINLQDMGFTYKNIENIGKVSHIDGFDPTAPVPEPATMLLLGSGLAGLAAVQRRKAKKN